ncbi:hypothetical protein WK24_29980 [Burkholderia vietnamiensis]|nr:hypothetical protein WK24_29980 [Burkholderia vietnamiensis]KVS19904.1 hypothetical protein WK32_20560 [Burkholderia vietnamiensis]
MTMKALEEQAWTYVAMSRDLIDTAAAAAAGWRDDAGAIAYARYLDPLESQRDASVSQLWQLDASATHAQQLLADVHDKLDQQQQAHFRLADDAYRLDVAERKWMHARELSNQHVDAAHASMTASDEAIARAAASLGRLKLI